MVFLFNLSVNIVSSKEMTCLPADFFFPFFLSWLRLQKMSKYLLFEAQAFLDPELAT